MSRYRHAALAVGSYFFTLETYRRQPILCDEAVHEANDLVVPTTAWPRSTFHRYISACIYPAGCGLLL